MRDDTAEPPRLVAPCVREIDFDVFADEPPDQRDVRELLVLEFEQLKDEMSLLHRGEITPETTRQIRRQIRNACLALRGAHVASTMNAYTKAVDVADDALRDAKCDLHLVNVAEVLKRIGWVFDADYGSLSAAFEAYFCECVSKGMSGRRLIAWLLTLSEHPMVDPDSEHFKALLRRKLETVAKGCRRTTV